MRKGDRILDGAAAVWLGCLTALWLACPGRWQLYPAVFGGTVALLRLRFFRPRRRAWTVAAFPLFTAAVSALLCWAMPVWIFPPLSGPERVGTTVIHLRDPSRTNAAYDERGPRELLIQAWYPADVPFAWRTAPYFEGWEDGWRALARERGLPRFLGTYFSLVRSRSFKDVPLRANRSKFPVILFSPGLGGFRGQNTYLNEELASRGFVVLAVDHVFDSAVTVFPDGRTLTGQVSLSESSSREERAEVLLDRLRTRVADLRFVMDELPRLLSGKLDSRKVAVYGHGFGGATAAGVCSLDRRCAAGTSLAGSPPAAILAAGTSAPFLFVETETFFGGWLADRRPEARPPARPFGHPAYQLELLRTAHGNLTDLPFWSPLHRFTLLTGEADGKVIWERVRDLMAEFFEAHLRGGEKPEKFRRIAGRAAEARFRILSY